MNFYDWEPLYKLILEDMGFDRRKDELAATMLSEMLEEKAARKETLEVKALKKIIYGKDVLVCGKAPSLAKEIEGIDFKNYVTIAADGATSVLMKEGITPDIIVTDLDGNMDDEAKAGEEGAIMVVHAHGDNIEALRRHLPRLKNVIGTTQAKPLENVHNFGGFTDGDRGVFLATEFGARTIKLIGFDFKDTKVTPLKKKKLIWAERLIGMVMGKEIR